jgi:hypothetical protein
MSTNIPFTERLIRCLSSAGRWFVSVAWEKSRRRADPVRRRTRAGAPPLQDGAAHWDDAQIRACLQAELQVIRMKAHLALIQATLAHAIELRRLGGAAGVESGERAETRAARDGTS